MRRYWSASFLMLFLSSLSTALLAQRAAAQQASLIDVDITYQTRQAGSLDFQELRDGNVVHSGDMLKIIFETRENCYVYIFQVDTKKRIYSLFPMEQFGGKQVGNSNPVQAGQTYYAPGKSMSFELDNVTGAETIYFLAYRTKDPALEAAYQEIEAWQRREETTLQQLALLDQRIKELQDALAAKGMASIVNDPGAGSSTWDEDGRTHTALMQRLAGLCDGCSHVLRLTHK